MINKAGYTATQVAFRWAGRVMNQVKQLGRSSDKKKCQLTPIKNDEQIDKAVYTVAKRARWTAKWKSVYSVCRSIKDYAGLKHTNQEINCDSEIVCSDGFCNLQVLTIGLLHILPLPGRGE